jgi:hypothetical protein
MIKRLRQKLAARIAAAQKRLAERIGKWRHGTKEQINSIRTGRQHQFRMFDSITLDAIPSKAKAVAGYVNGSWPTYKEVVRRWPQAKHLSIAVTSSADADCLDVEEGDATPTVTPGWVKRQQALGNKRPAIYTSVSAAPALITVLARAGINRTADATQFTNHSGGRNLDESLCEPDFL